MADQFTKRLHPRVVLNVTKRNSGGTTFNQEGRLVIRTSKVVKNEESFQLFRDRSEQMC